MINMESISHIWNVIVRSNTFNFVIFVFLIALILKKINIGLLIETMRAEIIKVLDAARKNQREAKNEFDQAQKAVANLGEELKVILEEATKSADVIGEKILAEAKSQIDSIEANAVKVIEAEEKLLISKLAKNTSKASVDIAKSHIEKVLQEAPTLHEKFIDESIDELDKLNL